MNSSWIVRMALCLVAASAIAGCGKAAPTARPMAIDSVLTNAPADDAQQLVVQQQQARRDNDANNAKTAGSGTDNAGN